jgi:hypothetical protein
MAHVEVLMTAFPMHSPPFRARAAGGQPDEGICDLHPSRGLAGGAVPDHLTHLPPARRRFARAAGLRCSSCTVHMRQHGPSRLLSPLLASGLCTLRCLLYMHVSNVEGLDERAQLQCVGSARGVSKSQR